MTPEEFQAKLEKLNVVNNAAIVVSGLHPSIYDSLRYMADLIRDLDERLHKLED